MTMTVRPRAAALPDIDDDVFRAQLQPLADRVLPGREGGAAQQMTAGPTSPSSGVAIEPAREAANAASGREGPVPATPAVRGDAPDPSRAALEQVDRTAPPDARSSGVPANRRTGTPVSRTARLVPTPPLDADLQGAIEAIHRVAETRAKRGSRKGYEFLLPDRVVHALRVAAAEDGVSMSVKLLQILRNAGMPVIDEDFVDLRRLPKR